MRWYNADTKKEKRRCQIVILLRSSTGSWRLCAVHKLEVLSESQLLFEELYPFLWQSLMPKLLHSKTTTMLYIWGCPSKASTGPGCNDAGSDKQASVEPCDTAVLWTALFATDIRCYLSSTITCRAQGQIIWGTAYLPVFAQLVQANWVDTLWIPSIKQCIYWYPGSVLFYCGAFSSPPPHPPSHESLMTVLERLWDMMDRALYWICLHLWLFL